jgi:hypothetical protein
LNIEAGPVLDYRLSFKTNLKDLLPVLKKKPLYVIERTELDLKDQKTSESVELEVYSKHELMGVVMSGAKAIQEGNYLNFEGIKMAYSKTEIKLTKSIEKLIESSRNLALGGKR